MAQKNETEVVNGVVQPRFYQVYGDLIESKEVMEPLAIMGGTGPICGFDWVDTTQQNITITSIFKRSGTMPSGIGNILGKARRVFLSNKDNTAGQVFNAYTTPDGLCHIAPDTLTFTGVRPDGGWPSLTNPQKLVAFAVKASHTYRQDGSENPPSISNFGCGWITFDKVYGLEEILSWGYEKMLSLLESSNIPFNKDTDTLIGIYLVGWRPEWNSDGVSLRYKDIMASLNYTLCLVPYNGQFPVKPYGLNPLDLLDLKSRVKVLEESTVPTDVSVLTRYLNTQMNSQGKGIEIEYSISKGYDYYEYTFSKLVINGCVLAEPSAPVSKKITDLWKEDSFCICIYTNTKSVLTNASLHYTQWDITRGYPNVDNEAELWDGSFDKSSMGILSNATLVAVFEISSPYVTASVLPEHAYSLLNNEKVDGLTRAILGLFRYTLEKGNTGLDTSVEQTTSGSGSTRSRLTVKAHYHNGVAVFDLTEIMFPSCPSFEDVAVNVTDLLTAKDSRWGPILTQIAKKYSSDTYGYGPYMQKYGDTAYYIEIYPNLFTTVGMESFRVTVSGNNGTSDSDLRAYKVQLTFVVGDVEKNTPTNDARLLLACLNNPFKSNY
jgi:hypothetical protein|nr:MAG TPA: hypothetical protein [Caudoviricetes sp.]